MRTFIKFQMRQGRRLAGFNYVTSVHFADGPGYQVKSVRHSPDRSKAMPFSLVVAEAIAAQYPRSTVVLEREDGSVNQEATSALAADAKQKRDDYNAAVRKINEEMRPFVQEIVSIITSASARIEEVKK